MGMWIYDQISISRNCSKVKLRHAVSLRLGLKGVKIAQVLILRSWLKVKLHRAYLIGFGLKMEKIALNIVNVGMHSYFPNADLNLWLNFNFEKLLKRETSLCGLLRLRLKGVKIFWNVSKVCMHACWSNWHPNLWSNWNSKKLLERKTPSCGFNRVGLKGGQNSLKRRERWRACLYIQYASKYIFRFKF